MSDHDDKAALRRSIRAGREATTGEWRDRAAAEVIERLVGLLDDRVATVMSYLAFGAELDLGGLHDRVLAGGGRLVVPRVHGRLIEPVEYRDDIELVTSRFGIAEPVGEPVDPYSIDVVLVPAVCFDRNGHRIGYGAGFYDRFLPLTRPDCRRIGVSFALQVVGCVPSESHDQPVHLLVTEEGVTAVGDPRRD